VGHVAGGQAAAQEHQDRDEDAVHGGNVGGAVVILQTGHAELPQVAHVREMGRQRRRVDALRLL
jgi:hypothetical protein